MRPLKIVSRWAGCPQALHFHTACAVNAQTWLNGTLNISYCLENRFTDGSADGMISDERQKMVMHGLCCGGRRFPEDGKGKYI